MISAGITMLRINPLIKLALPFIVGIAVGWYCNIALLHICSLLLLSTITLLLSFFNVAPQWKTLFGVGVVGAMLSLGMLAEFFQKEEKSLSWNGEKGKYTARLIETPLWRGTSVKVLAELSLADAEAVADDPVHCAQNGKARHHRNDDLICRHEINSFSAVNCCLQYFLL